jgi:hypothetical protein
MTNSNPTGKRYTPKSCTLPGYRSVRSSAPKGIGDMYRIYLDCQRDGIDFNLAYITEDFDIKPNEDFDSVYMGKLFDLGYQLAKNGYPWEKAPPGFE